MHVCKVPPQTNEDLWNTHQFTGENCIVALWPDMLELMKHYDALHLTMEYLRGKYHCTVDLLFDWFR
jgi:hypothetical protein